MFTNKAFHRITSTISNKDIQHYALCHAQKAVLSLHVHPAEIIRMYMHSCVTIFEIKGKTKYTTRQKSNRKIVKT